MAFKLVSPQVNFPEQEKEILKWWYENGLVEKYLHKNDKSKSRFSFLDGPITANNPMGVHHAWGRTYKDLWQRFYTMQGARQRYQNGFDCQGLWVEVEVEKELGFKTKKDIEIYGVANFVNKCKERVLKYASIQTEQSKRLGYFMDWDNSYFTMSDDNNYAIWNFLKVCSERGWIYKGHDSVPWCPRCETAISQHEMLTEDYKELTHETVFFKLPIHDNEFSLVAWTTTPWTIPANVALAVNPKFKYTVWELETGEKIVTLNPEEITDPEQKSWFEKYVVSPGMKNLKDISGADLVGLTYRGPFDNLPRVEKAKSQDVKNFHTVVAAEDLVVATKGTGILHIAPGAGEEDFHLAKEKGLPIINVIADNADYLDELGEFSGKNAKKHPELIIDHLRSLEDGKYLYKTAPITHRYPACWRCKTELVWKIADEWYISMDKLDPTDKKKRTLRQQMMDVAKKITWLPSFGLDRELDWLKNMHDWLISKKNRYWGLALPIYECQKCGHFEVIGSKDELKSLAIEGWQKFEGNSPHKPWIDEVKIKCNECGEITSRIADVGNPWLDAGIVPFSTMSKDWFPADFITESFPGQFKNWFYALIAMSTVLTKENPYQTVLGFATLFAEDGKPMHKSAGNMIEFNEGAEKIGVDVMRWMYAIHNPDQNLLFGYKIADETRRRFHLMLWNIYNFFITYANLDKFEPGNKNSSSNLKILDEWINIRLQECSEIVSNSLKEYDSSRAANSIEDFVKDFSLWYIRRSRDRVGPTSDDTQDKMAFYHTTHQVLLSLVKIMAPFTPYMSEAIYQNLVQGDKSFSDSNVSINLESWPELKKLTEDNMLLMSQMKQAREIVEKALATRKNYNIKVRQPLWSLDYFVSKRLPEDIEKLIADEINVKKVIWKHGSGLEANIDIDLDLHPELKAEGEARELIRQIQDLRKQKGLSMDQFTDAVAPSWPQEFSDYIKKNAMLTSLTEGPDLAIK